MKYPVKFDEKERKVYLSGEAYFEVAKDPERPFFVEMEGVEVRVYGTSFNVNTHQEREHSNRIGSREYRGQDFGIRRGEYDKAWADGRV